MTDRTEIRTTGRTRVVIYEASHPDRPFRELMGWAGFLETPTELHCIGWQASKEDVERKIDQHEMRKHR